MVAIEPYLAAVVLDDLAAHRQPDAGSRIGLLGVQALEDDEDPIGVLGVDADAVVRAAEAPEVVLAAGREAYRGRLGAAKLDGVGDQVLKERYEQRAITAYAWELVGEHGRGCFIEGCRERLPDLDQDVSQVDQLALGSAAPDAGEGEQVVDQDLHSLRAVDCELDVLVGALVELAVITALERLAEARNLAQWLLEVVRGDIGELLELRVRSFQLERLPLQLPVSCFDGDQLAHDTHAHLIDLAAQFNDLARAGSDGDRLDKVAGGNLLGFAAQARQRSGDDPAQQEAGADDAAEDQPGRDQQHDLHEARVFVQLAVRAREPSRQVCPQAAQ